MDIVLNTRCVSDYERFLKIKSLPNYRFAGRTAWVPDEYANRLGGQTTNPKQISYTPSPFLFDYQADITRIAIRKRKFSIFADCGLGKTLIYAEYIKHINKVIEKDRAILIVSPLMVIKQTLEEFHKWYGSDVQVDKISAKDLGSWSKSGSRIGITNFEALSDDLEQNRINAMIIDESSMLKSHYGKWGQTILRIGKGMDWKLAGTGTPAPNDRIEYANHAVLMDAFPNVNSFLARFFVNKAQTGERWILKPHALRPFYQSLSHWSVFLTNPATYGWNDHIDDIPPIHVKIHNVPLTDSQNNAIQDLTGQLMATESGGIGQRSKLGQIAKGSYKNQKIDTNKPEYIRSLIESWPEESTIIWCIYNNEQEQMHQLFPEAANITGDTPFDTRQILIDEFKSGVRRILITKPKILGFGLNLQIATRQVFSGLQDSYESFYQAVKRSNRVGSIKPLSVHIPITSAEEPMVQNVLKKAKRVQHDADEQEQLFKQSLNT
tara:strand:+ start:1066 stop:2544 length:1479 start_codon:yes stop_codon:yes gene_type:complete